MVDLSAQNSVHGWNQTLFVWLFLFMDEHNNVLATSKNNGLRRRLTTSLTVGNIRRIVGNYLHADNTQEESIGGNGGAATSAVLGQPIAMAYDSVRGKLYITESDTGVIRKIGIAPPPILQTNDYGIISTVPPPQPHFVLDNPHGIR